MFNIPIEKACKRCDGGEESVSHAIFNCYKAREVWRLHQQYIYKFNQAQQKEQPLTSIGGQKWQPPSIGYVKINFDGAWNKETRLNGVGAVIRDYEGKVLRAYASKKIGFVDSFMVEAKAAVRALEFAYEMRLENIIILERRCTHYYKEGTK